MKVCFFFDNTKTKDIDYTNPLKGNPGIGGTEYMIWTISYYLNLLYKDIDVYLLTPYPEKFSPKLKVLKCENIYDSIKISKELKIDILILRGGQWHPKEFYEYINKMKQNIIMWSHNFEKNNYLDYITKNEYIKRNISVSKEQYQRLLDHEIFQKSDYIYNCLDFSIYNKKSKNTETKNTETKIITYMGALNEKKGFHKLAEIWPVLNTKYSNLELHIIGSGKLYDKNTKLGKYELADENYEKKFIKYLIDSQGKIQNNVKFFGDLSHDKKIEVIMNSDIGIVNPIAKDETFCISAIEFQALGVPVIGRKTFGLLETIKHNKTGVLISNQKKLLKSIINLLEDKNKYSELSKNAPIYVRERFDISIVIQKWYEVLKEVCYQNIEKRTIKTEYYFTDKKYLRILNKNLKYIFKNLPAVCEYPECIYNLKIYKKLRG